ncbi:MAG TPA: non-homologous end-joining DNA ligase, partial [Acidimicrobiia bacterium]|nr:non-homologous end-joining DNA ligase [Acidimicrobiia bacterium]
MAAGSKAVIDVEGRQLTLSNLEKVLYPATGATKAAVIAYYSKVAPTMLPHLAGRAVTMVRFPDGVGGNSFFEKRCPSHAPPWVHTGQVDPGLVACVVDDAATLVWMANLAALELHTLQARVADPDHPTSMVFDLDPGPPADVLACARVALELQSTLTSLGLVSVAKTSGSKGLHLAVPVRGATADETKTMALGLGQLLAKRAPDRVTVNMAKEQRPNRIFVDWSQNDRHKTTVAAYSLRAQPRPMVSTPVTWDEVSDAVDAGDP